MPIRKDTKYLCVTDYGHRYLVNIEEEKVDMGRSKFITIRIGTHSNKECISITLRLNQNAIIEDNPYLHFFYPRGICELTGKSIEGETTIKFLILGLYILQEVVPNVPYLEFFDDSVLKLDENTHISLKKAYTLLYGDTWYGIKFGAKPGRAFKRIIIEELERQGFKDRPLDDGVPEEYYKDGILQLRTWEDFRRRLTPELNLILDQSNTWCEFFKKVATLPNKYRLIQPWLEDIFASVFKNRLNDALNDNWIINIDEAIDRYPPVRYEKILLSSGSGIRRRSRSGIKRGIRRRKSIRL